MSAAFVALMRVKPFNQILETFEKAGYKLVTNLYKFEEYGVPQARHRIIIVGIRNDQDVEFKVPSTEPYRNHDVSARTALEQLLSLLR